MEELKNLQSLKDIINIRYDLVLDKTAFIEKEAGKEKFENITYREVKNKINGLGTYMLNKLNINGEKIAVIGENSHKWYVTYMAVACGVGIIVPLDKGLPENEILSLIERSDVRAIVYSHRRSEMIQNIREDLPEDMIYIDMQKEKSDKEALSMDEIIAEGIKMIEKGDRSFIDAKIDNNAFSVLLYTSGTSDKSKGVMLSHKNLCANIYSCSCVVPTFGKYTCFSILPMHHTYEFTLDYLFMTAAGGTIGICQGLKYFSKDIKIIKPDFVLCVPAFIERISKTIEKNIKETGKAKMIKVVQKVANGFNKMGIDFRRSVFKKVQEGFGGNLKYLFCGAAPLDPELIDIMESYGFNFLQGYGLTETSPLVSGTTLKFDANGTVGKAVEGVEIRIDLSKNEDENSNIGEIIVKGDNVMLGYYNDPKATKEVLKDGWFYTGDLGYFNVAGNLVVTGRKKNVIVTANGKNIYPEEIENLINKLPFVAETMVYGKNKDKKSKDVIVAARITLDREAIEQKYGENNIPSDYEIYDIVLEEIKRINRMLSTYKNVKELEIKKDEFVKTTTMKVKRKEEIKKTTNKDIMTLKDVENYKKKIKENKKGKKTKTKKNI